MIGLKNKFEYKSLEINGLDIRKHEPYLKILFKRGWFLFRTFPDTKLLRFKYKFKRSIDRSDNG